MNDYIGNVYENNSGKFKVLREIQTPISFSDNKEYRTVVNYLSIERTKLPHHNISLLNDIKMIPFEELMSDKHLITIMNNHINTFNNKIYSSTTIPFGGEIPH